VKPAQRRELYARLAERNPHPTTELAYATPFQLLVAVVLSAQSTDKGVNKVTATLFRDAPTPQAIAALGAQRLEGYLASLGLFRMKAKNVAALAERIVGEHGGEVPQDREALEQLPGVGRKTANVVLNTAFGQPTIAVDTHIFRVANRTGLAPGRNVTEVERALEEVTPPAYRKDAHHWLILHGRYTCIARKPKCPECPILDLCEYPDKTPATTTAARPLKKAPPPRHVEGAPPAPVRAGKRAGGTAGKSAKSIAPAAARARPSPAPRGAQPFAKTSRAGTRRGRSR
jgi:endonuclease-3